MLSGLIRALCKALASAFQVARTSSHQVAPSGAG